MSESEETSVLVLGIDELASAVARKLHLAGHAVAINQPSPPETIRRRMGFADAWSDGTCTFEGVEARRADKTNDFLNGLRSGNFIPVLWHPFDDVTTRWPWDVIVDARPATDRSRETLRDRSMLTIGLGRGFVAGETCDIVIDIGGRDPGAVLREGAVKDRLLAEDEAFTDGVLVPAPQHGLFHGSKLLGEPVEEGQVLGFLGTTAVIATANGRLRGLARDGGAVGKGAPIAEIATASQAECVGISKRDRLIARSVGFVIEIERSGVTPISLESFF
jgi:xanthine dehydrogenase accessory factor